MQPPYLSSFSLFYISEIELFILLPVASFIGLPFSTGAGLLIGFSATVSPDVAPAPWVPTSQESETAEHLFTHCPWSRQLWGLALSWAGHGSAVSTVADTLEDCSWLWTRANLSTKGRILTPWPPSMSGRFGGNVVTGVSKDHQSMANISPNIAWFEYGICEKMCE